MWSLGVSLLVALTGLFPWVEATPVDTRYAYWAGAWGVVGPWWAWGVDPVARARCEDHLVGALCELAGRRPLPRALARLLVAMLNPVPAGRPDMHAVAAAALALGPYGCGLPVPVGPEHEEAPRPGLGGR